MLVCVSTPQNNPMCQRLTRQALESLSKEQLIEIVLKQDDRIAELERRLGMNSQNSSKPPSSDLLGTERPKLPPTGRRPGGQPGHPGHCRRMVPLDRVDKIVPLKPLRCRHCGASLSGEDRSPLRHQVTELPPIRPIVTEYQRHRLACPRCGQSTLAELPPGVDGSPFDERLRAVIAICLGACHLPQRMTEFLLEMLFNVPISLGAVNSTEQFVSDAVAVPVAECLEYVQQQPVVNADETGWRNRTERRWLWAGVTKLVTVFLIHTSRGQQAAQALLGEFKGILGSDRWAAYNFMDPALRQLCWAHLNRDFQAFVELGGAATQIGTGLLHCHKLMFQWWHRVRDRTMSRTEFHQQMALLSQQVEQLLDEGTVCGHARTQRTCRNILKLRSALWTFVHVEGVEPTNNAAERPIRSAVLWRKVCLGSQSEAGCRFVERMLTVTATLKQQGRNVVEYLTEACHASVHGLPAPSLLPRNTGA